MAVGVVQNAGNVGLFALQVAVGVGYLAASVIAGVVALALSYLLNRGWTFRSSTVARDPALITRYVVVFVTAVGAGLAILTIQVEVFDVAPVVGQIVAVLLVAPLSYAAQRLWVFGRPIETT